MDTNPHRSISPEGTTGNPTRAIHVAPSGLRDRFDHLIHGFAPGRRVGDIFNCQEILDSSNRRKTRGIQLEKVVRGFFDPELFLDYMRYFVLFEDDGDSLIKKDRRFDVTTIAAADSDEGNAEPPTATQRNPV